MSREVEGVEYVYLDLDTDATTNYRNEFTTLTDTVNVVGTDATDGQVLSGSISVGLNWAEHSDGFWSYDWITPNKNKSLYRYILEI